MVYHESTKKDQLLTESELQEQNKAIFQIENNNYREDGSSKENVVLGFNDDGTAKRQNLKYQKYMSNAEREHREAEVVLVAVERDNGSLTENEWEFESENEGGYQEKKDTLTAYLRRYYLKQKRKYTSIDSTFERVVFFIEFPLNFLM